MLQTCAVENEPPRRMSLRKQIEPNRERLAAEIDLIMRHRHASFVMVTYMRYADASYLSRVIHMQGDGPRQGKGSAHGE
jgi:hypothetical protein